MKLRQIKHLKLSDSGRLAVVIGLAYLGTSAFAADIEATGTTRVSQKNGVDIVDIARPNANGLSHNQYNRYDVRKEGAVLNNALKAGESQLAGHLDANSNFQGKAASVILNEVVSKNPSLILGKQEVFGMVADYVLANPNGITTNGGSVINAPRTSLVVGKPDVAGGKLSGFVVGADGSDAALNVGGRIDSVEVLDLVAPRVVVNKGAHISAKNAINVVSGSNKVGYRDHTIEKLAQSENAPVLDGQIFGSMKAGAIRIHATDERATQNIREADLQAARDLRANIAGKLNIEASKLAGGNVALSAKDTFIGGIKTTREPQQQHKEGMLDDSVAFTRDSSAETESFVGSSISADNNLTLNNSGTLHVNGSAVRAGRLKASAENIVADGTLTTDTRIDTYRRSKGWWHNQTTAAERKDTVHASSFDVKGNANFKARNRLDFNAATLKAGGDVGLRAANGMTLSGMSAAETRESATDVRNETASLKTGTTSQAERTERYAAADIRAGGRLNLQSAQHIGIDGAKVHAGGDVKVNAGSLGIAAAKTADSQSTDDSYTYWGGLGGGADTREMHTRETLQAGELTAGGKLAIAAKHGVDVAGSVVKGVKDAVVDAGDKALTVRHAATANSDSQATRQGTVFNITKSSHSQDSIEEVVTGSTLASDTNLRLATADDVNVTGSKVHAGGDLDVAAKGNVRVGAAAAHNRSSEHATDIQTYGEGKADLSLDIKKPVAEASGSAGIRFSKTDKETVAERHTGAELNGRNVKVTAGDSVVVTGSDVTAQDQVDVDADHIVTRAAQDSVNTTTTSRVTTIGVTGDAGLSGYKPKGNVRTGIDSSFQQVENTRETAKTSAIRGGNVKLRGRSKIAHEGTTVNARHDLDQTAANIVQTAAHNTDHTTTVEHSGGVFVGGSGSVSGGVKAAAGIYGKGGKTVSTGSEAVATRLASENTRLSGGNISDVGTQYHSEQDVSIDASGKYTNTAAADTSSVRANHGGAGLTVTANSKNVADTSVNVTLQADYQHRDEDHSKAKLGEINARNVKIASQQDLDLAANVTAEKDVTLTSHAGRVNLNQSDDTARVREAGASVGVGATVNVINPALSQADVHAAVDYADAQSSTGKAGTITAGGNVKASAHPQQDVNVNGASIRSGGDTVLSGKTVNSRAIEHRSESTRAKVAVDAGVRQGWEDKSQPKTVVNADKGGDIGANVGFSSEQSVSHTANMLSAGIGQHGQAAVTLKGSDGLRLSGTEVTAQTVNLNAGKGSIDLDAAKGSLKRTGAGVNVGIDMGATGPVGGRAKFKADTADNTKLTAAGIKANSVRVDTSGDLNLNSSTVTAQNVSGRVGGALTATGGQNVTREVAFDIGAEGKKGINPADITAGKSIGIGASDLKNGTILGVQGQAGVNLHVDQSQHTQAAGITAERLDLDVGKETELKAATLRYGEGSGIGNSRVVDLGKNTDRTDKLDFGANLSSNLPQMVKQGIEHVKTGSSPLFHSSRQVDEQAVASGVVRAPVDVPEIK